MSNYETISAVDFGYVRDDKGIPKAQQPDPHGEHPAGSSLTLTEEQAAPLLAAGAIKVAGVAEPFRNDNPEEHGYQGQELREQAQAKASGGSKRSGK